MKKGKRKKGKKIISHYFVLLQPIFGGKWHSVTGSIVNKTGEELYEINGCWDSVVTFKNVKTGVCFFFSLSLSLSLSLSFVLFLLVLLVLFISFFSLSLSHSLSLSLSLDGFDRRLKNLTFINWSLNP
jgi:hypothetical protein